MQAKKIMLIVFHEICNIIFGQYICSNIYYSIIVQRMRSASNYLSLNVQLYKSEGAVVKSSEYSLHNLFSYLLQHLLYLFQASVVHRCLYVSMTYPQSIVRTHKTPTNYHSQKQTQIAHIFLCV